MSERMTAVRLPSGERFHVYTPKEAAAIYKEVFLDREYLRHGIAVRAGSCVFDVGANIGMFSLFAHGLAEGVRIHAFEPAPRLFEILKRNAEEHFPTATLHPCGLGESSRVADFTFYPSMPQGSTFRPFSVEETADMFEEMFRLRNVELGRDAAVERATRAAESGEVIRTEVRALSDVVAAEGIGQIDLLKIDTEGSEWDVLSGIRDEDWPKIAQIVMELHNRQTGRAEDIERLLTGRGYEVHVEPKNPDPMLALMDIRMVYATRAGRAPVGAGA